MAEHRTRKSKENPHYTFLYSWTPKEPDSSRVKRELDLNDKGANAKLPASKRAEILAKDELGTRIKKDIARSLIRVSFILALEVVVYLAWRKFVLS